MAAAFCCAWSASASVDTTQASSAQVIEALAQTDLATSEPHRAVSVAAAELDATQQRLAEVAKLRAVAEERASALRLIAAISTAFLVGIVGFLLFQIRGLRSALGVAVDEQRRIERDLEKKTIELETNLRARDQMLEQIEHSQRTRRFIRFAGMVVDETNTALQAINEANGLLRKKSLDADVRAAAADASNAAVERCRKSIDQLSQAGGSRLAPADADQHGRQRRVTELAQAHLLLVEDDDSVAHVLIAILEPMVDQVERVSNGEAACELLAQGAEFDLILSDVRMPGTINGVRLAGWVDDQRPEVRVGLMTGFNEFREADIKAPIIHKPFDSAQLEDFLKSTLSDDRAA